MSNAATLLSVLKPHDFLSLVRKHRPWLRPIEAAAYLGLKPRTLESWRATGKGPAFRGGGKGIRYHVNDLDAFVNRGVPNDAQG